jgi:hypothetical protein
MFVFSCFFVSRAGTYKRGDALNKQPLCTGAKTMNTHRDIFARMAKEWPSPLVAAAEVKHFSGGIISGKTLANLRSRGETVPDSIKVGARRAYQADSLAEWLRQRATTAQEVA